jgi:PAS domain S-box-containing protein
MVKDFEKRLKEMLDILIQVAKGNYSVEVDLSPNNDELDDLGLGINLMIKNIRQNFNQLEEQRQWSQVTLSSIGDAVIATDNEGNITFINHVAEELTGWSAKEAIGKDISIIFNIINEKTRQKIESPIRKVLKDLRISFLADDTILISKDGHEICIEDSAAPIQDKKGNLFGVILVFRDITEKKKAQLEQELMKLKLNQAQKLEAIGQLASGIAHEINTPIQAIGGNTSFLQSSFDDILLLIKKYDKLQELSKEEKFSENILTDIENLTESISLDYVLKEIPKAIDESLKEISQVANIVKSMKEFSHPGAKEKKLTDINNALQNSIIVSKNEWKYHADMKTNFQKDLPLIPAHPGELNQAFLNIIINAAHAIKDGLKDKEASKGEITISSKRIDDKIEISISDSGTGIPEDAKDKIFDPFFTTKEIGSGTGQGLFIAHSVVVEKHNGSVEVESEMGKGTTFYLRFPINSNT